MPSGRTRRSLVSSTPNLSSLTTGAEAWGRGLGGGSSCSADNEQPRAGSLEQERSAAAMKIRIFLILAAAIAALLPACGGGGHGSGGTSGSGTGNPAFPVTMTKPSAGQIFTAAATISLSAVVTDPANVAKVEFVQA